MRLRIAPVADRSFSASGSEAHGSTFDRGRACHRLAAAVGIAGTCALAFVSVAQPASGAATDSAGLLLTASAGAEAAASTPIAPIGAETTPVPASADAEITPAAAADPADTAPTAAVSPVIPPEEDEGVASKHLLDAAAPPATTGEASAPEAAVAPVAAAPKPTASALPAPVQRPTKRREASERRAAQPSTPRYHAPAAQYQLESAAKNSANLISQPISREPSAKPVRIPPRISGPICISNLCDRPSDGTGESPHARDTTPSLDDPIGSAPISDVLGTIGAESGCGNTNISVRISSPGDDGPIAQAGSGSCGHNTNISIRINSPGDNGPVSQAVRPLVPSRMVSTLGSRLRQRPVVDPADAGPKVPGVSVDPAKLPGQLDRSARHLADSLVAKAQAKAGLRPARRAPRAAPPRRGRSGSGTTSRTTASARIRSSGSHVEVAASASATVATPRRHHRRYKAHAAPPRKPAVHRSMPAKLGGAVRRASAALPHVDSGRSNLAVAAMLAAFAAAMAGAYLLVPPIPLRRGFAGAWAATRKRGLRHR